MARPRPCPLGGIPSIKTSRHGRCLAHSTCVPVHLGLDEHLFIRGTLCRAPTSAPKSDVARDMSDRIDRQLAFAKANDWSGTTLSINTVLNYIWFRLIVLSRSKNEQTCLLFFFFTDPPPPEISPLPPPTSFPI